LRSDGRENSEIRKVKIVRDYTKYAEGSVLFCQGDTVVLCNATVLDKVPLHKKGSGEGWVTAEYSMLPRATMVRNQRDIAKLKLSGRSAEIQRLIGRALRSAVDLSLLGERTIVVDCDVIQADGGTRTASVNGGFTALQLACRKLLSQGVLEKTPVTGKVGALSAGIKNGALLLDLSYEEDSETDVDCNVVLNENLDLIEIQGTGENAAFSPRELQNLVALCKDGIEEIFLLQESALSERDLL
jgi:ribonuclease PH